MMGKNFNSLNEELSIAEIKDRKENLEEED